MATKKLVLSGILGAAAILFSSSSQAHYHYHQPVPPINYNLPYQANIEREVHYFPWGFSKEYIVVRNKHLHERRSNRRYYHRPW